MKITWEIEPIGFAEISPPRDPLNLLEQTAPLSAGTLVYRVLVDAEFGPGTRDDGVTRRVIIYMKHSNRKSEDQLRTMQPLKVEGSTWRA